MTTYDLVYQAIEQRKIIRAMYDGTERVMCPHVLGRNKQGRQQALCYQFAGESRSRPIMPDGSPNNWRCIVLEKLTGVTLEAGSWHTAPNHTRPQTCVAFVEKEVIF